MRNSNYSKAVLILVFGLLFSTISIAQTSSVTGTVTAEADGLGIPGVTIQIKGTTRGTITDMDGHYSIDVMEGEALIFSFVGMKAQEIPFTGQATIDVSMSDDFVGLEEVVAIGYGSVRKEDLTGSVTPISAKDFNVGAIASPQELVTGKIAGVQITSSGGEPGAGSTIRIRGGSSLNASNDPLIVVDGVPLDNDGVSGMRNPLNVVNPNDIETMTILKDASATAIYGSRASNGVILITTKKGASGALKVDYSGNVSVATPRGEVDVLSRSEYIQTLEQYYPSQVSMIGDADTDWQDEIYRTAISTDHNVALSGTIADMMPFRASVGYNLANGILDQSQMQRTTTALNLNPKFFDDHLSVNAAAKYMHVKNNFSDQSAIGDAIGMDPTQAVRMDDEYYDQFGGYFTWNNVNAPKNGRARIDQRNDLASANRFVGNLQLDYKFHFLPELRANMNMGYDFSKSGEDDKSVPGNVGWDASAFERDGYYENYGQEKRNKLFDFYLQYQKSLDKHNIDLMAGHSYQSFWIETTSAAYWNTPNADSTYIKTNYSLDREANTLISFFGRLNYNYDHKYYLTATLRNDLSSKFSEENRSGFFPSVAATWNLKNEDFLYDSYTLSALKLRAGVGVTGQENIGEKYGHFGTYTTGQPEASYVYYDADGNMYYTNTIRPEGYDRNLKWEETTTYNVALDYGFLNNRIYGSVDFYLKDTKDLLSLVNVPAGSNLSNQLYTNVGTMENKGVEFSVNTLPYANSEWKVEVGANYTYNTNKITNLTLGDDATEIETGGISGGTGNMVQLHRVGYEAASFYLYEQVYDANGKPIEGLYVDRNEDGVIDENDKYIAGNSQPRHLIGINGNVSYKEWDFSFSGRANLGMYVYDNVASNRGFINGIQTNGEYLSNIHSDALFTGFREANYFSDYYLKNGSFFRMDNISLGYTFQNLTLGNAPTNMRVYGTVNNAFVITKYKGLDPEIQGGIDNNLYPRPRTFTLGLTMSF